MPFPCLRIEGLEKILIEIENGIAPIRPDGKNFRCEAVDGIAHHFEANSDVFDHLGQAQHAQCRPHQRMFLRHMLPCVCSDRLTRSLANQQQPECERLRESSGEQRIEIGGGISSSFRVSIENVPKLLPHLQKCVTRDAGLVQLSQSVAHDAANQTGGVRHQRSEMFSIARDRFLPRRGAEHVHQPQKRSAIVLRNCALCAGIVTVGP